MLICMYLYQSVIHTYMYIHTYIHNYINTHTDTQTHTLYTYILQRYTLHKFVVILTILRISTTLHLIIPYS